MRQIRRPTIAERADALAKGSGLYRLTLIDPKRRHLRWLPIATLALATAGLLTMLVWRDLYWPGWTMLMTGLFIGNLYPIFGPLRPMGQHYKADERETRLRIDAYGAAYGAAAIVAVVGLFALAAAALLKAWDTEYLARVMIALALYLVALFAQVPTLYASWATRPLGPEDDA